MAGDCWTRERKVKRKPLSVCTEAHLFLGQTLEEKEGCGGIECKSPVTGEQENDVKQPEPSTRERKEVCLCGCSLVVRACEGVFVRLFWPASCGQVKGKAPF